MTIDSLATVLTALLVAVGATALLALAWDRRRAAGRIALAAIVVLAVTTAAALQLNRLTETYPAWSALFGRSTADSPTANDPDPVAIDVTNPQSRRGPAKVTGPGRLVDYTVHGNASGLTMPMTVYLPAAYTTAQNHAFQFPVIEAFHGFPGTPAAWPKRLDAKKYLDQEIAAGRMSPTVVLFPYQTPNPLLDTECLNLAKGPQTETYLTRDVPGWARDHLRVRTDPGSWGLIGFSAGGYCAMNLAMKHPDRFSAAASLSGLAGPGIKVGDDSEKTTNSIAWRLTHQPAPPVSLYIAWAADDAGPGKDSRQIARLAKAPLSVTTATMPHGGHSLTVWRRMEAPAFDWLSAHLNRAAPAPAAPKTPSPQQSPTENLTGTTLAAAGRH
jgi:enterochelin esterase-like enzyme